ncbi:MAG TPA: quinolinate synthase NadA [Candidatus Saccharimonadales bacterium]|nr:quinolinate synthase NadA [Candidatus Saccharimonadales bacterium]
MPVLQQVPLPEEILAMEPQARLDRIREIRARLGRRLLVLGHHYQRDEIIQFADARGDSLKLARHVPERPDAENIVFCGVHFMAESADILAAPHQRVVLPDLNAGCSMADMAGTEQVEACWEFLTARFGDRFLPVTYINSTAAIKNLVGRAGGSVCTSTNCPRVLEWAFAQGKTVLFLPDQHLGRNTAFAMGVPLEAMCVWDPWKEGGGLPAEEFARARIILWKGHCSVHQRFTLKQVEAFRKADPQVRVVVHGECSFDVVQAADVWGSTEKIIRTVREAPAGTHFVVGTEINLVHRLAHENPEQRVEMLDPVVCVCSTMYRIDPPHLLWTLESILAGEPVNVIRVPAEIKQGARLALERMLQFQ